MSFLCCLVYCLNVSFSRLITSVEERELFFLLLIIRSFVVSVRRSSSSSWCLRKAALFIVALPVPSI